MIFCGLCAVGTPRPLLSGLSVAPASRREQINAEGVTKQGFFREPEKESEWCAPLARLMLPAGRRGYLKKPLIIRDFSHKPNSNGHRAYFKKWVKNRGFLP